jgi:hypothetical protein
LRDAGGGWDKPIAPADAEGLHDKHQYQRDCAGWQPIRATTCSLGGIHTAAAVFVETQLDHTWIAGELRMTKAVGTKSIASHLVCCI